MVPTLLTARETGLSEDLDLLDLFDSAHPNSSPVAYKEAWP
jgi:hypothetical protein